MLRTKPARETFGAVLEDVRRHLGVSLRALGEHLGAAERTMTRWMHHESPPAARAFQILHVLAGLNVPAPLLDRVADALGAARAAIPMAGARPLADPTAAADALEASLFAEVRASGLDARGAHAAVVAVLARAAELQLDARTAHKLLDGNPPARAKPRRGAG